MSTNLDISIQLLFPRKNKNLMEKFNFISNLELRDCGDVITCIRHCFFLKLFWFGDVFSKPGAFNDILNVEISDHCIWYKEFLFIILH